MCSFQVSHNLAPEKGKERLTIRTVTVKDRIVLDWTDCWIGLSHGRVPVNLVTKIS